MAFDAATVEIVDTVAATPVSSVMNEKSTLPTTMNDNDIISLAKERYANSKILEAYRLLQSVTDKTLLSGGKEQEICKVAMECQTAISDLLEEPDHTSSGSVWKKQGESHGDYDTTIFYKVENSHLTCRLETPIQSDLLIPLLSVLNESNLYSDWIPSWKIPFTIGIRTSQQFQRIGQLDQIVQLVANVPWPFLPREVYIKTMVIDEIDDHNYFAVRLFSVTSDDEKDDTDDGAITIPPPLSSVQRFDFLGVLLFRPCPIVDTATNTNSNQMIEVSFKM
jgi:hypothetical protein